MTLQYFCQSRSAEENIIRALFQFIDNENRGYISQETLIDALTSINESGKIDPECSLHPQIFAKELFDEMDSNRKGYLTYWEIYLQKNSYQFKRIQFLFETIINQISE